MSCDISLFNSFLNSLHDNENEIITHAILDAPLKYGFSFGSCNTLCGSLGVIGALNLNGLVFLTDPLDTVPPTVQFSNCGASPLSALLRVAIYGDVTLQVRAREQSPVTTWPDTGSGEFDANATLQGEMLFTFPMTDTNIEFSNYSFSVNFIGAWNNVLWPNQDNVLFQRLPLDKLVYDWTKQFTDYVSGRIYSKIRKLVLLPDFGYTCTVPNYVPMACTAQMKASTYTTISTCHPCDTCCKCFVQQRCDSGCDKCACVNCAATPWILGPLLITIYIAILIVIIIMKCYNNQFSRP